MTDEGYNLKDSVFEILLDERMNKALDQALLTNQSYKNTRKGIDKQYRKLEKTKLSKKQFIAVDKVISAHNFNASEYGRAAYKQGFRDCLMLIQELYQLL
ncbi:hypothetical protein [Enterocloster bolteae]|uniref:hypothetical protein n=1 Tax=Enterocloster bolteae TaxID=208479 RepID=UPI00189FB22A|nr:hypothetical protein [Enterocloster bolteae]